MTADSGPFNSIPPRPGGPDPAGSGNDGDGGEPDAVGADDVAWLSTRVIERTAGLTRLAGTALIVVGALGVAGWLWVVVRQQQRIDDFDDSGSFGRIDPEGPSLVDRIDAFAQYVIYMVWAGLALAAGVALRLAADYTVVRSGGSVTDVSVGDPVPHGGLANAPQTIEVDPFAG